MAFNGSKRPGEYPRASKHIYSVTNLCLLKPWLPGQGSPGQDLFFSISLFRCGLHQNNLHVIFHSVCSQPHADCDQ